MKYSIEIGKIIEGALKRDQQKVKNYTAQLISKLTQDGENLVALRFQKLLDDQNDATLSAMGFTLGSSVPVDQESRTFLADVIYPHANDANVILSKTNAEKIESFILSYKNADKLNSAGLSIANTVLLYGPPGCGKTKCAYLIAKYLDLPLVIARLDSLISSYLGTTAKNIRTLFEYAQRTPCVLFLDEFDAIAKARDDSNELGELKRVVNSLLQNVDAMSQDSLLIAATNHERLLDSAVWRRFEYRIQIDPPDKDAIIKMIYLFSGQRNLLEEKEIEELSIAFNGLSGANIEEIIKKAYRNTIVHNVDFSVNNIYEEFFSFSGIIPQGKISKNELQTIKAKFLRKINSRVFSLQRIANILGCSKTTVQRLVKEVNDSE